MAEYLVHLRRSPRRRDTVGLHRRNLERLSQAFSDPVELTADDLERWFETLLVKANGTPYLDSTKRTYYWSISGFCEWLVITGRMPADPTKPQEFFPFMATKRARAAGRLDDSQVLRALGAATGSTKLMVALTAFQGLSPQEIASLSTRDIKPATRSLVVRDEGGRRGPATRTRAERGRSMNLRLQPQTLEALEQYEAPRLGRLFSDETNTSVASKIRRFLIGVCQLDASANSLNSWYTEKRDLLGQDFGRRLSPEAASTRWADADFDEASQGLIARLDELVPSAALSYRQALRDIEDPARISFRGTANELRSAVWDVLETFAPDNKVTESPGFKFEPGLDRPTHKQRALYVSRHFLGGPQQETFEPTYRSMEEQEHTASLARGIYRRGSASAHMASTRSEVLRTKEYVDILLRELLGIPR